MKTIKKMMVAGAMIVSAASYAQTVPATEQQPTTPQSQQQQPATQQNSETFTKPETERALNPVAVPLSQGAAIKDTIVPGKSKNRMDKGDRVDTMKTNSRKGSGELDTTGKSATKSDMKKKRRD